MIDNETLRMPSSVEAERAVLGTMITDVDACELASSMLHKRMFYNTSNRVIFDAISTMYNNGDAIDITTLSEYLSRIAQLENIGGTSYLLSLVEAMITPSNVEKYIDIIREKAHMRKIISVAQVAAQHAYDGTESSDNIIQYIEKRLDGIMTHDNTIQIETIGDVAKATFEKAVNDELAMRRIKTGFPNIDEILNGGIAKGSTTIIAGRPAMGKSAFVLSVLLKIANNDIPVLFFPIEMHKSDVSVRAISMYSKMLKESANKVHSNKIIRNTISTYERENVENVILPSMDKTPLYIVDKGVITPNDVRTLTRQAVKKHGIEVMAIDYLQILHPSEHHQNREREIAIMSSFFKNLARDLDIAIILVSQLSRNVENRNNKKPLMVDLRESGTLENDASIVMLLYRPDYYGIKQINIRGREVADPDVISEITEVNIAKHRNGETGMAYLRFDKKTTFFEPMYDYEMNTHIIDNDDDNRWGDNSNSNELGKLHLGSDYAKPYK